jgi:hypothetical protein
MAVSQTKAPRVAVVTEAGEMTTVSRAIAGAGPVESTGQLRQPRGAAPEPLADLRRRQCRRGSAMAVSATDSAAMSIGPC